MARAGRIKLFDVKTPRGDELVALQDTPVNTRRRERRGEGPVLYLVTLIRRGFQVTTHAQTHPERPPATYRSPRSPGCLAIYLSQVWEGRLSVDAG